MPIIALVSTNVVLFSPVQLPADDRPNIILAMADDQGWRDVAYNADPDRGLQTPNMDRMAQEGIRFNRFYASSPNCSPTRAGVLTGRHCHRSGVFNPGFAMRPQETTIAEVLKKAGFATAHFGKWHMGPVKVDSPFNPHAQGFDYFVSHDNFFEANPQLSRNGNEPETFSGDGSEVIVEEALKYLDRIRGTGKPFLLVIWFGSPHRPHKPL
jgi:arylsulfatase A-like enzyme